MCRIEAPAAATAAPSKTSAQIQTDAEETRFFNSEGGSTFDATVLSGGLGTTRLPKPVTGTVTQPDMAPVNNASLRRVTL